MSERYDVIIVGGGPAALAAGVYAGRADLKTVIFERMMVGGQVATTWGVENYPGFPEMIGGMELSQAMEKQAKRFGAEVRSEEVTRIEVDSDGVMKNVTTNKGAYSAPTVIIACGADPRKLGVPGEEELRGRGVSYCGTCDGPLFRDKSVVVIGGGDAAITEGIFIAKFASKVTVIHRRDELRAEKINRDEAFENPKIAFEFDSVVDRIVGDEKVTGVEVRNVKTDEKKLMKCDGVFVFVGHQPNTGFLDNLFGETAGKQLETDCDMMTSVSGVYAIGDVRKNSYMQIATAVGEGAIAAMSAEKWIGKNVT